MRDQKYSPTAYCLDTLRSPLLKPDIANAISLQYILYQSDASRDLPLQHSHCPIMPLSEYFGVRNKVHWDLTGTAGWTNSHFEVRQKNKMPSSTTRSSPERPRLKSRYQLNNQPLYQRSVTMWTLKKFRLLRHWKPIEALITDPAQRTSMSQAQTPAPPNRPGTPSHASHTPSFLPKSRALSLGPRTVFSDT